MVKRMLLGLFWGLLVCGLITLIAGCGTQREAVRQEVQDMRTETRYERIFVHDTVYIDIPAQTAERTVRDSASHLENDYAVSEARINADGSLFHSLQTKARKKAVPVDNVVERRDSVVYVDKREYVPVPVEKELTKWESFKVDYFVWLAVAFFALLAYMFRKPLVKVVRRSSERWWD